MENATTPEPATDLTQLTWRTRQAVADGACIGDSITATYFFAIQLGFDGSQAKWGEIISGSAS